jgi:hypothetical protein
VHDLSLRGCVHPSSGRYRRKIAVLKVFPSDWQTGQYLLTTAAFLTYTFGPVAGSSPVTYQLSSVADRNGQGVSLSYTGSQLTRISAAGGRYLALGWNGDGTLGRIGDHTGRGVSYRSTPVATSSV